MRTLRPNPPPSTDKHTVVPVWACSVHDPVCTVAVTYLTPDTFTTFGGSSTNEHCPVPPGGDPAAEAAQPTPMEKIATTAESAPNNRIIKLA